MELRQTDVFERWIRRLIDLRGKARILARIERLAGGYPGDAAPVGEGVSEMRIDCGPGYRVYFIRRGAHVILLLAGGDKASQARDIQAAKHLARAWKGA